MKDKIRKNQTHLIIITLLISFTGSLAVAEWVLSYQRSSIENSERMDAGMIQYDAELGWALTPYWSGKHHHYDYDAAYTIDANGFRADIPAYRLTKPSAGDVKSYAIVGDSFSFGLGVNDDQTFTAVLNKRSQRDDKKRAFFNFSVPGYSTDQQLLLIKNLAENIPENIVLVVYLANDIFDNMRPFPLQAEHGKPFFSLQDDNLKLNNTPVPLTQKPAAARDISISSLVLASDHQSGFIESYISRFEISRRLVSFQSDIELTRPSLQARFSKSLHLFSKLVAMLNAVVTQRQGQLSVVLLPGRSFVESPSSAAAQYQAFFRESIKKSLVDDKSVKVIDLAVYLQRLFDEDTVPGHEATSLYFPNDGHLTPHGHAVVAGYLFTRL